MTLLGKIFRPWDLPEEDSSKSEESQPKSSVSDLSPSPKDFESINRFDFCEYSKSPVDNNVNSGREADKCYNRNEVMTNRVKQRHREESEKSKVNNNNNNLWNQASQSFPSDSSSSNKQHHHHPSLFLHPSAIDDLANLSRNELTAMGLLPPDPPTLKVKRQRPKRFHCPHCQVAFSNNGQLRGHVRIHTGERPFSCEYEGCGKSFTRNEELTRHRRIHSGLRPFPCSYCGKKFGRKDHLKKHTRTHQRPMFNTSGGMIGFGNPFHPFNPPLMSSPINNFTQPSYGLPFVLSIPPPNNNFPFS